MPNDHARILQLVWEHFADFASKAFSLALVPKHAYILLLVPLWLVGAAIASGIARRFNRQQLLNSGLVCLLVVACSTTIFLVGAKRRGQGVFELFAANNPQVFFVQRKYEVSHEIIGSLADRVAFFTEIGDSRSARDSQVKGLRFLQAEAPDQVLRFKRICQALQLRHALGWYRLMPEQSLVSMEEWYDVAMVNSRRNLAPPDVQRLYRY
jgi:hypothetical protein